MASGYSDLSEIRKGDRTYGASSKPPKIDLLNERPRRESIVEQQLKSGIIRQPINTNQQVFNNIGYQQPYNQGSQDLYAEQQSRGTSYSAYPNSSSNYNTKSGSGYNVIPSTPDYYITTTEADSVPMRKTVTTTVRTIKTTSGTDNDGHQIIINNVTGGQQPSNDYYNTNQYIGFSGNISSHQQQPIQTTRANYFDLTNELAHMEAKSKREIAYSNLNDGPWSRPKQIREPRREPPPKSTRNEQRWIREVPICPTSRPNSRASSTRSTTTEQDLLEKAEKLLKDVQEINNKPLVTQQILIESGARRSGSSNDNNHFLPIEHDSVSSIHTAVIKVPRGEVNNKSPLPFSYDNFSTLGVRGNIASVGAAPPDQPYAPIFPMIKRTPSPTGRY